MKPYRIALLGFGTVGSEVLALLAGARARCEQSAGRPLHVVRVGVRNLDRPRNLPHGEAPEFTDSVETLCEGPDVDLVVELVGGVDLPRQLIRRALESGKDVVTANKAVLAEHGDELFALATDQNRQLLFEASVAGAVPILQSLQSGLPASRVRTLTGILNGTCNHVLASLQRGRPFEEAVKRAQEAGFAEADPTLDLDGTDSAHKLALLARILTGRSVSFQKIPCTGIQGIAPTDLAYGLRHGWVLKLIARFEVIGKDGESASDDRAALAVYPAWVQSDSFLAGVSDEYNGVRLEGEPFGTLMFEGKGAGGPPTAGSVVADIVRAARGEGSLPPAQGQLDLADPSDLQARYYVRCEVPDRPGVLGRIAGTLGDHDVSIASVDQPEPEAEDHARIHLLTHPVAAGRLEQALASLDPSLVDPAGLVRIRLQDIVGKQS